MQCFDDYFPYGKEKIISPHGYNEYRLSYYDKEMTFS